MPRVLKPLLILLSLVALLAVAAWFAHGLALRELQSAVLGALGPRASVASLSIDHGGVELRELRIASERGTGVAAWPADDELRAARVRMVLEWRALWPALTGALASDPSVVWRVARIEVDNAYVSVLRTRQGGLRVLPSVLEAPPAAPSLRAPPLAGSLQGSAPLPLAVHIGQLVLNQASVDFFDASVSRPAHRLQLVALQATIGPLDWPALNTPVPLDLQAELKGRSPRPAAADARNGRIHLSGQVTPATRDARIKARLTAVDLRVLQPYLLKVNEGGVERGRLDLLLDATVQQQRLHAPGTVVLTDLALGRGGSFAGVPQQLVVAAMRQRGRIELKFTLAGGLDDPAFSVNENLATRIAVGLAESLGVSVGGAVEGLGGLIKGLFGK